ncbi:MAG: MBL fold metallo-hydrolase, partial [Caldimonas sp.]
RRKLDLHQTTFAMGESVAHLHALWFAGKLRRQLDADGVYRFTSIAS